MTSKPDASRTRPLTASLPLAVVAIVSLVMVVALAAIAQGGAVAATDGKRARLVAQDVPPGYFPSVTTDTLGRPIYSVSPDYTDPTTRVSLVRHLDGSWRPIELPLRPLTFRYVPTVGLFDGTSSFEPGRYVPVAAEDLGMTTTLSGSPVDLLAPSQVDHTWATAIGLVDAKSDGFALEDGTVLANLPTHATNDDGHDFTFELAAPGSSLAADSAGRLFVVRRDLNTSDGRAFLFVHFPGDGVDAWTQVSRSLQRLAAVVEDGSGRVWVLGSPVPEEGGLGSDRPMHEIVVD